MLVENQTERVLLRLLGPRTHGRTDAWTHGRMDAWTHGRRDAWSHGRSITTQEGINTNTRTPRTDKHNAQKGTLELPHVLLISEYLRSHVRLI